MSADFKQTLMQEDGDDLFLRVDTFTPSNKLAPGTAAGALNKRFEDGKAWPRLAVNIGAWGRIGEMQTPQGYARFNDPNGVDNTVLVTDDWRDGGGEDGGRGRAWRILSGQAPQEIPLNGHDIWDTCRLIPCLNALVLLRQGNERHYFSAAALDVSTSRIQLNAAPNWATGELVLFWADPDSYILGTSPPNPNTLYWVKNIAGNKVELYSDAGLTTILDLTGGSAVGTFYLERRATEPGFFGNGAPPLIMQPDGAVTAFENGFKAVPTNVAATAFDATSKILTAKNHRLIPGDQITYIHNDTTTQTFYVNPSSVDGVRLYTSVILALAGGTANAQTPSPGQTAGDVIKKAGASGHAMPPGREGVYLPCGRLLIVNGRNNVAISDPLDPLHFTPFSATLNANLGESDVVTCLIPLGNDSSGKDITLVGKENSILKLIGLSGASSGWELKEVTREYGFGASLATTMAGSDCWGFSRKGVVSINQTAAGVVSGVALPVSWPMKAYLDRIDWKNFRQACAATWNNRYFLAVPLKGQTAPCILSNESGGAMGFRIFSTESQITGEYMLVDGESIRVQAGARIQLTAPIGAATTIPSGADFTGTITYTGSNNFTFDASDEVPAPPRNNGVLVYNFITQGWEGLWQANNLEVYGFARHYVYGEERLTFVNYAGEVCWFGDGWVDRGGVPITDELTTRMYCNGNQRPKLWLEGTLVAEVHHEDTFFVGYLTVTARAPGHGEEDLILQQTYDPTKYTVHGRPDYNPDNSETDFDIPHREDYSPSAEELLDAPLDVHQNINESLRMRVDDWGVQLVIGNNTGSVRIAGVNLNYVPQKRVASLRT